MVGSDGARLIYLAIQNGRVVSIVESTGRGFQLRDRNNLSRTEIYISYQSQTLELVVTFGRGSVITRTVFCGVLQAIVRSPALPVCRLRLPAGAIVKPRITRLACLGQE